MAVLAVQLATRIPVIFILILVFALPLGALAAESSSPGDGPFLTYTVRQGDTLLKICSSHRDQTNHYSLTDMLTAIRAFNGLESNFLRIGQTLKIPLGEKSGYRRVTHRMSAGAEMRGIYLTGPACGVSSVLSRVDRFIEAGGNAVVFDAKDIDGGVSYFSRHPLASWGADRTSPMISSLDDMMERFDKRGLHVVPRIALFLDGELGSQRPDLALHDSTGAVWAERGCVWIDPAQPEVVEYNLALAGELARAGVDEIQFDYVRFPTNGWEGDLQATLELTAERRRTVISGFLEAARDTLDPYGVQISADLYGIMAWGQMEDLALTGQHVPTIASLVDVICPMIYPSHFGPGFEGRKRPGDDPQYFIGEGTRRFREMVAGQAEIRPWLQAFPYLVSQYDGAYIETQILAARAAGGMGWSLWNPACRYDVALEVIPELCSQPVMSRAEAIRRTTDVAQVAPHRGAGTGPVVNVANRNPEPNPRPDNAPDNAPDQ
jgi:hypothetical protein